MTDPIMYAAMWLALAALMLTVNLLATFSHVAKALSFFSLVGFTAMAALTLLGIVAVPS